MKKFIISILFMATVGFSPFIVAKERYQETYNMLRAREEVEKGNYKDAKEYYEKELKENPDNGYANLYLAVIDFGNGQYNDVFPNLSKAQKYIPKKDKDNLSLAYALQGETFLAIGDTVASLKTFYDGLSINPKDEFILENIGQIYYLQSRYDESDKNFRKMIELNPGNTHGYMGLGRNEYKRGNFIEAINHYNKAIILSPEYSSGYSFRADAELQQKKYVEAADDIIKALEIDWDEKAQYLLSQFPDDQISLIIAKLRGMAVNNPYEATWPYYIAQLYYSKREYNKALDELQKALEIDAHPVFLKMMSDCYQELGDFNSALKFVNQALDINPEDVSLIGTKGDILEDAGDINGALEMWTKFIELTPDFYIGYYRRGFLEDNANKSDEALADYTMAVTLQPDNAYGWLGKADMHLRKGEMEEAMTSYKKVVELDTVPQTGSCAMYALLALGEKEKGKDFMEKLLEVDPKEPGNYYEAACFYSRYGDLTKSLANLRTSFEKGFHQFNHVMADDDLEELRKTSGFKVLMEEYQDKINSSRLMQQTKTPNIPESDEIIKDIIEVPFTPEGGCASVKCTINDLPLTFIFDTGASIVSMSQLEASFMLKNGFLKPSDFVGTGRFIDANGDVSEGSVINLRNVEFGGLNLSNVKASVVRNQTAPLLLGQTVLGRLGSIEIDNTNQKLIIKNNTVR